MAGLLDLVDDPGSQGLLSLGLRLMASPERNFGTALGQSGLGALGDLNSAAQAKQRRDLLAQEERSRAMQMQMLQQQMAQQQEAQARRSSYLNSVNPDAGPAMPMNPAAALSAGLNSSEIEQLSPASMKPIIVGDTVLDPRTFQPLYTPPQKPEKLPEALRALAAVYGEGSPEYARAAQQYAQKLTTHPAGASVSLSSPIPYTLPDGSIGYIQPSNKAGAAPQPLTLNGVPVVKPREGNPRTGPMSVTLQKELLESDDIVQSSAGVVRALEAAKLQNNKAYDGYFAKQRAQLTSNLVPGGTEAADATIDIDNLMTGQGLDQMKAIFGAAPTEGERKILLDMQASVDKTPTQRQAIMDRAIAAAKRRADFAARKAASIRDGSYLTDGVPESGQAPAGGGTVLRFDAKGNPIP